MSIYSITERVACWANLFEIRNIFFVIVDRGTLGPFTITDKTYKLDIAETATQLYTNWTDLHIYQRATSFKSLREQI
jgi:hypothetical protein